ncbi:unnamed protein product [Alopecurus aequalis]
MAEACPAYPWQQDGAQRGDKMFMSGGGDCASCHQGMFREPATAARGEVTGVLQATEIVFAVTDEAQPAAVAAAYTPDLATLATKIQERQVYNNVYFSGGAIAASMPRMLAEGVLACQELKKKMALQFA